jgi:glycosyl transferase family 2
MSQKGSLSVMIPAFNEERTLELILKHVLEQPEVGEVIAVDDGSTDRTWAIMRLTWLDGMRAIFELLRLRLATYKGLFGRKADPRYHQERQRELSLRHPLRP